MVSLNQEGGSITSKETPKVLYKDFRVKKEKEGKYRGFQLIFILFFAFRSF